MYNSIEISNLLSLSEEEKRELTKRLRLNDYKQTKILYIITEYLAIQLLISYIVIGWRRKKKGR